MIDRNLILDRAQNECITELFAKSQPPLDYQKLLNDIESGQDYDELYDKHHYLSLDDYYQIIDEYANAYGFTRNWDNNINIVNGYFSGLGAKSVCVPGYVDDNGVKHDDMYTFDEVPHIKNAIYDVLLECGTINCAEISSKISDKIFEYLEMCEDFYELDSYADIFNARMAFCKTPSNDKDEVVEYWKSKNIELEINENTNNLGITD